MGLKNPTSAVATVTTVTAVTSGGIPEIAGAAGIPTWPAAAAAGNGVSLSEVLRYIEDALIGTAGVVTYPTALPAGNGVSLAEVIRYIQENLLSTTGAFIPGLGFRVTKSHNLTGDNTDLFTVTGANRVSLMFGEVTTVVATTTTYLLRIKTDNVNLCAATTITTDADGTMYLVTGDPAVILNGTGPIPVIRLAFSAGAFPHADFVIGNAAGSCIIESDTSGAGTGVILWTLWYQPLELGASIVAA